MRIDFQGGLKVISLTSLLGPAMALTQAVDSMVHGRTVSVRPSRNRRVMEAS